MADDHNFTASDGGVPMIYRRNRIVATACVGCRLSLNACQANREVNGRSCCEPCSLSTNAHECSASSDD